MRPVEPTTIHEGARRVVFGAGQDQYVPLPATVDGAGLVQTEWEPSAEDLGRLFAGGRLRIWLYTFGQPLQPVAVEVTEPIGDAIVH